MANVQAQSKRQDDRRNIALVSIAPIGAAMTMTGPQGLTWLITIYAIIAAIVVLSARTPILSASWSYEAKVFFVFLGCFLLWTLFRTVTAPGFSDAVFAISTFLISFVSAGVACRLSFLYSPRGRWYWSYFPAVTVIFTITLVTILTFVTSWQYIQTPTARHLWPYHYNRATIYLCILWPIAHFALAKCKMSKPNRLMTQTGIGLAVIVCSTMFSDSQSAALLAAVVPIVWLTHSRWPQQTRFLLMFFLFLLTKAGPFAVNFVFDYLRENPLIATFRPGTIAERFYIWKAHDALIWQAPLTGNGVEYFRTFGALHPITGQPYFHNHAHSFFFQVWTDLGFVGAFLLASTLAAAVHWTRVLSDESERLIITILTAMIAVWAVSHGMWQSWYFGMCGILLSISLVCIRRAALEDGDHAGLRITRSASE